MFQVHVCRFKSVDCDCFGPSSSVNFEGSLGLVVILCRDLHRDVGRAYDEHLDR